ncbi:MAG: alpha/beta hydrolase [Pseudomonadota bacterium]|nr:alpha/beta hydrolase [Pseudomonadota bacterium]
MSPLDPSLLPPDIHSRILAGVNGLDMHLLEAGGSDPQRPLLILLHGFPEIGYSWRKLMLPLAAAGFHVVAPDQRGYGRTTGWEPAPGAEVTHGMLDWVRDAIALVSALGHRQAYLVGHDFGSQIAAAAALIRPDVFRSVALMSSPFTGPPALQTGTAVPPVLDVPQALAALPRPRKHYQHYFASPAAVNDLQQPPQGLQAFLRAYFHVKSADWAGNVPQPMQAWTAEALAQLPTYYVMDAGETMPQTVAHHAPSAEQVAACHWFGEAELAVYVDSYRRSGFSGALQFYRCRVDGRTARDLSTWAGRRIEVPACFISGRSDWGPHQKAGDLDRMRAAFSLMGAPIWIDGAGHWVQQERSTETAAQLLAFLRTCA